VPSLALGAGEVTLESLTSAYSVFATGGVRRKPFLVRRVEDSDGAVLYSATLEETPVITPQSAFLMTNMLSDVINSGTAWRARQLGFRLPAAGKTGTTNDYHDAWFVGYTPKLVTGVWVGFDQPQPIISGGYAAEVAVPLWATFMRTATRNDKPLAFPTPEGIVSAEVCRLSGKRPADGCDHVFVEDEDGSSAVRSMVYTEYFVSGTEPTDTCPMHVGRSIFDRIAGWFGAAPSVAPPSGAGYESAPAATAPAAVDKASNESETKVEPEPEKKKRGFWSRLFGRRDKDEKDEKKKP
jgi:membrane carboxypeptidase/penicillin-binding protein